MPTFALSVLRVPPKLLKEIDKCRRRFLWKQEEEITGASCKVNWQTVCAPTEKGGLGILDLQGFSRALRLRWLWIAWKDPDRPWVGTPPSCDDTDRALFAAATTVTVGDGRTALFWQSTWMGPGTLAQGYPSLFKLSRHKNRTVFQALQNETWINDLEHGDINLVLPDFLRLH